MHKYTSLQTPCVQQYLSAPLPFPTQHQWESHASFCRCPSPQVALPPSRGFFNTEAQDARRTHFTFIHVRLPREYREIKLPLGDPQLMASRSQRDSSETRFRTPQQCPVAVIRSMMHVCVGFPSSLFQPLVLRVTSRTSCLNANSCLRVNKHLHVITISVLGFSTETELTENMYVIIQEDLLGKLTGSGTGESTMAVRCTEEPEPW